METNEPQSEAKSCHDDLIADIKSEVKQECDVKQEMVSEREESMEECVAEKTASGTSIKGETTPIKMETRSPTPPSKDGKNLSSMPTTTSPNTTTTSVEVKPEKSCDIPMSSPSDHSPKPPISAAAAPVTAKKDCPPLFKPDELRQHLLPTLEKLYKQDPESIPFRQPVDPQALGIPDYFDIIKKPMDLSTIKRRLDTGYYTDPWAYVDDVWLMFDNAWIYNKRTSRVYRYCTKVRNHLYNF